MKKNKSLGIIQLPILIGIAVLTIVLPVVTTLVRQRQEIGSKACTSGGGMCSSGSNCCSGICELRDEFDIQKTCRAVPTTRPTIRPTSIPATSAPANPTSLIATQRPRTSTSTPVPTCVPEGGRCSSNSQCCQGSYCDNFQCWNSAFPATSIPPWVNPTGVSSYCSCGIDDRWHGQGCSQDQLDSPTCGIVPTSTPVPNPTPGTCYCRESDHHWVGSGCTPDQLNSPLCDAPHPTQRPTNTPTSSQPIQPTSGSGNTTPLPTNDTTYRCNGNILMMGSQIVMECDYGCNSTTRSCSPAPTAGPINCSNNGTVYANGSSRCTTGSTIYFICQSNGTWMQRNCPTNYKCQNNRCTAPTSTPIPTNTIRPTNTPVLHECMTVDDCVARTRCSVSCSGWPRKCNYVCPTITPIKPTSTRIPPTPTNPPNCFCSSAGKWTGNNCNVRGQTCSVNPTVFPPTSTPRPTSTNSPSSLSTCIEGEKECDGTTLKTCQCSSGYCSWHSQRCTVGCNFTLKRCIGNEEPTPTVPASDPACVGKQNGDCCGTGICTKLTTGKLTCRQCGIGKFCQQGSCKDELAMTIIQPTPFGTQITNTNPYGGLTTEYDANTRSQYGYTPADEQLDPYLYTLAGSMAAGALIGGVAEILPAALPYLAQGALRAGPGITQAGDVTTKVATVLFGVAVTGQIGTHAFKNYTGGTNDVVEYIDYYSNLAGQVGSVGAMVGPGMFYGGRALTEFGVRNAPTEWGRIDYRTSVWDEEYERWVDKFELRSRETKGILVDASAADEDITADLTDAIRQVVGQTSLDTNTETTLIETVDDITAPLNIQKPILKNLHIFFERR